MEELIALHSKAIERFALQCGFTGEQAAGVAEDTFRTFQSQLVTTGTEQPLMSLYEIAFELMQELGMEHLQAEVFPFEEDTELHSAIIGLASETRVPFILSIFHQLSVADIAAIMKCTPAEIEERLLTAHVFLGQEIGETVEERLDKRLEFLEKSYNRKKLQFNRHHVRGVERPVAEDKAEIQKKKNSKGLITAAILGVLLIGLISVTYFGEGKLALGSDERYVEKIRSGYEKEKNKRIKMLGNISDDLLNEIPFFEDAENQYGRLIKNLENQVETEKIVDRDFANREYNTIIESLKLPSELVADLVAKPLVDDPDGSIGFMNLYIEKINMLAYPLSVGIGMEMEKFIEKTGFENFDMEGFLAKEEEFDEEVRSALNALKSQNMLILPYLITKEKRPDPSRTQFLESIRKSLHKSAHVYLAVYEKEIFVLDEKLVDSLEETVELIEAMDAALQDSYEKGYHADSLEGRLPELLEAIIAGKTEEPLRNEDGTINEVFRDVWKNLASLGPDSGVGEIMTRVVSEMEETGWTQSELHDALNDYRTYEAYQLAIEGRLILFQMDEEEPFQEEFYEHKAYYESLLEETTALYELFSVAHDQTVLSSVQPLVILSLYYYANELEDPLTMWHVMDEESRHPSAEEYVRQWTKERPLFKEAESVHFDPGLLMGTDVKPLVPIEFQENGNHSYDAWMTYENGEVWKVQRIVDENKGS